MIYCNNMSDKTILQLERYEKMKKTYPELFSVKKAAENLSVFESNAQIMLDGRDCNGAKIFLYRIGKLNFDRSLYFK